MTTSNLTLKTPSPAGLVWQVTNNETAKSAEEREAMIRSSEAAIKLLDEIDDATIGPHGV